MKKSVKSTVILNKNNSHEFLDFNFKRDFDKVMEALNKINEGNQNEK